MVFQSMKRRVILTLLNVLLFSLTAYGQDPGATLFTYAKDKVTVEEFERYFLKNINIGTPVISNEKIREDLDLYIKFKLKLQDARDAGVDTTESYVREVEMFRDQLARGYLYDREVTDALIREAYERMQYEVEVSHILVIVGPRAKPADTQVAYARIKGMLDRIRSGTSTWDQEAKYSDDPGTKDIGGNLGYMTAMQVVYPFENQAYTVPVGGMSEVFRTDFGYHIIKVTNKRPNRGDIKIRHILLRVGLTPEGTEEAQKRKMEDIYAKIKSGESTVAEMARNFSEDFNSRNNGAGGEMDYVNVPMFIGDLDRQQWVDKAFALAKNGDYSEPFRTGLGWHIVQRMDIRPLGSFEQMKGNLKNQVQGDARAQKSVDALVVKVKGENAYAEYPENLNALIASLDTNFAKGSFKASALPEYPVSSQGQGGKKGKVYIKPAANRTPLRQLVVFKLAGENYTVEQFAQHLESTMRPVSGTNMDYVNETFNAWVKTKCVEFQDKHLEEKSPEFRYLYTEFREGILMFARMQEKVWLKANEDTTGLKKFHTDNARNYMWSDRFDCEVYLCADKKMMSTVAKQVKAGLNPDSIRRFHTTKNMINMDFRLGKYEKTDTFLFPDGRILETLFSKPEYRAKQNKIYKLNQIGNNWVVVKVNRFIPAEPKKFEECRGHVANDYQQYLETAWINELKARYPYEVNEAVLQALITRLTAK